MHICSYLTGWPWNHDTPISPRIDPETESKATQPKLCTQHFWIYNNLGCQALDLNKYRGSWFQGHPSEMFPILMSQDKLVLEMSTNHVLFSLNHLLVGSCLVKELFTLLQNSLSLMMLLFKATTSTISSLKASLGTRPPSPPHTLPTLYLHQPVPLLLFRLSLCLDLGQ